LHRYITDQDTYLLATQQPHALRAELAAMRAGTTVKRSQLYRYTSPGGAVHVRESS
jgi:hypothetical protein